MITPKEASELTEAEQWSLDRMDEYVTEALYKWEKGITITINVTHYGNKIRSKLMVRAVFAGWKVKERNGIPPEFSHEVFWEVSA